MNEKINKWIDNLWLIVLGIYITDIVYVRKIEIYKEVVVDWREWNERRMEFGRVPTFLLHLLSFFVLSSLLHLMAAATSNLVKSLGSCDTPLPTCTKNRWEFFDGTRYNTRKSTRNWYVKIKSVIYIYYKYKWKKNKLNVNIAIEFWNFASQCDWTNKVIPRRNLYHNVVESYSQI